MLKARITEDMKAAMRAGAKEDLGTIRLILAAIKQVEVDSRKELADADVLAVLDKMRKQRRESIEQYQQAGREDLAAKEQQELELISRYLPTPLTGEEIDALIDQAVVTTGATSVKDMGKVMGMLKPQIQGRADIASVSARIKTRLGG